MVLGNQPVGDHREPGAVARIRVLFGIEVVARVDTTFPFEPEFARFLGVEVILDFHAHVAREALRSGADE